MNLESGSSSFPGEYLIEFIMDKYNHPNQVVNLGIEWKLSSYLLRWQGGIIYKWILTYIHFSILILILKADTNLLSINQSGTSWSILFSSVYYALVCCVVAINSWWWVLYLRWCSVGEYRACLSVQCSLSWNALVLARDSFYLFPIPCFFVHMQFTAP